MKDRAVDKVKSEKRERALRMGREDIPATEIGKILSVQRRTVVAWLQAAGIKPVMLRHARDKGPAVSLRNTAVANRIERGVQARLDAMRDEEDDEAP